MFRLSKPHSYIRRGPRPSTELGTTPTLLSTYSLDWARPGTSRPKGRTRSRGESESPDPGDAAGRFAGGPRRAAGQTGSGRRDLGRNPSRLRPCARDVPGILRPGRESHALGRAGRGLPAFACRGREG